MHKVFRLVRAKSLVVSLVALGACTPLSNDKKRDAPRPMGQTPAPKVSVTPLATAQEDSSLAKRPFESWCADTKISAAQKITVTALLEVSKESECPKAAEALKKIKDLRLAQKKLSDLSPLIGLSQVTSIDLRGNAIVDVTPLSGLMELRYINLSENLVKDISSLGQLPELQVIDLTKNVELKPPCPLKNPKLTRCSM